MKKDAEIEKYKRLIYKERGLHNQKKDKVKITQKQGDVLFEYARYLLRNNMSDVTLKTKIISLKNLAYFLKKDFKDATKKDIEDYIGEKQKLKFYSSNTAKSNVKVFYKWLYKCEKKGEYPEVVDWIRVAYSEPQELSPDELITLEEVKDILIPFCHSFGDKCLISIMRETGARINEILAANIGDVKMEDDRGFIKLRNSKRRNNEISHRTTILIDSFYYLQQWLRDHPLKEKIKSDIPLFVNKKGARIKYHDVNRLLTKLKKESGFKKKINPHSFRHSQANDMAKILTDAELRIFGGWSKNSQTISRYTHLTSDDINQKRLKAIGKVKSKDEELFEKLQSCPRCNEKFDINRFKFCGKCGMALDKEKEVKEHITKEKIEDKLKKDFKEIVKREVKRLEKEIKRDAFSFRELSQNEEFMDFLKMFKATGGRSKKELEKMREQYEEAQEDLRKEAKVIKVKIK